MSYTQQFRQSELLFLYINYIVLDKKWIYHKAEDEKIKNLSQAININESLANVLVNRGIDTFDKAKSYFRPSLDKLHDPFLMKDVDSATQRILKAIAQHEKILIYGDYDVDGTTSVAMMYHFLSRQYPNVAYYIPDRYKEGYGISQQGIDWSVANDYSLIITLDCGIKANDLIKKAKEQGIDFIICDHHTPGDELPQAVAVLDPKRRDCPYPYKELSGCGVGFKLIQALVQRQNLSPKLCFKYLDLLAVSIASDIVPITGENRILAYHGLQKLNHSPRKGIAALIELIKSKKAININNIVFGIGPRINAAGRIAHASGAVDLLLSKTSDEAHKYASQLNEHNANRQSLDKSITQESLAMIADNPAMATAKSTVLYREDWHQGVVGIVASRCIEHYYRPTVILTESEGKATGSARSVFGYNVYNAIDACSELLTGYGGHTYAAGLSLPIENVEEFKSKFDKYVANTITDDLLIPRLDIDAVLNISDITPNFYNIVHQMAPFGPENMTPIFALHNVFVKGSPQLLKDKHLKFTAIQEGITGEIVCLGFDMQQYYEQISSGQPFSIVGNLEENEFKGVKSLQMGVRGVGFL